MLPVTVTPSLPEPRSSALNGVGENDRVADRQAGALGVGSALMPVQPPVIER